MLNIFSTNFATFFVFLTYIYIKRLKRIMKDNRTKKPLLFVPPFIEGFNINPITH